MSGYCADCGNTQCICDEIGNVADISKNKTHSVSEVICVKCYDRWICVRPAEVKLKDIECENCGNGYVIETGEEFEIRD